MCMLGEHVCVWVDGVVVSVLVCVCACMDISVCVSVCALELSMF